MALLTLSNVALAYGHVALLDHTDLSVGTGERIGLIGRNGTGKSSLLRIVAGLAQPDDGSVTRQSGMTVAFLEQEPVLDEAGSVVDAVAVGLAGDARRLIDYEHAAARVASGEEGALEALAAAEEALHAGGGWSLKARLESVLDKVGLDGTKAISSLSGGQRKRVALARALVAEPDLLLLDEPTNHLDVDTIGWLESLLASLRIALIVITHDRTFLDAVATRIVELDRGILRSYPGSYASYVDRKEEELASEAVGNAKFDKLLAQEEVWIRKGIEARRTRNEGRVRRLEALRHERLQRRARVGQARMEVDAGERSGKLVAELTAVTKSYGATAVVKDFSALLMRGDKVGVIGPNGAGKTTLLKLILGVLAPDSGTVRTGTNLEVAYFDQMRAQLDLDRTVIDTISPGSDWIEIGGQRRHVISYLGDFLFEPERARSPVRSLSGGERNRLLLARLFARPANVLVLDEPTNDLDIDTLELLEELLENYKGTVFLVSHDRTFIDRVVTQTIAFEGEGVWREYVGGYSDWERARAFAARAPMGAASPTESPARPAQRSGRARSGLGYKEQRELDALPDTIAALEADLAAIARRLAEPDLYMSKRDEATLLQAQSSALQDQLDKALARWEKLELKLAAEK